MPTDEELANAAVGFDAHVGMEFLEVEGERARGRLAVQDHHLQIVGLVHGGVYATMAESLCSFATGVGTGRAAAGMSNLTSFLRPITEGTIHVVAHPRHTGRSTWVWEAEFTDDAGRLCVISRVTVAVLGEPFSRDSGS